MSRAQQIAAINRDLVRAGYDPETTDVDALVDGTLNIHENRANVAKQLRYKLGKKPSARAAKKQANVGHCESLRHRCEVRNDKEACRDYGRVQCSSVTGKIAGCQVCSSTGRGRQKKEKKTNARLVDGICMIPVKSYLRRCSPKTAANMRAARGR
jgi:hypothetical protein